MLAASRAASWDLRQIIWDNWYKTFSRDQGSFVTLLWEAVSFINLKSPGQGFCWACMEAAQLHLWSSWLLFAFLSPQEQQLHKES